MKKHELILLNLVLNETSEMYSNHGCNDWEPPKAWTSEDKREFLKDFNEWFADDEETADLCYIPDWLMMDFLAHKCREALGKMLFE